MISRNICLREKVVILHCTILADMISRNFLKILFPFPIVHTVKLSRFFCHSDFTWSQFVHFEDPKIAILSIKLFVQISVNLTKKIRICAKLFLSGMQCSQLFETKYGQWHWKSWPLRPWFSQIWPQYGHYFNEFRHYLFTKISYWKEK